ncbi:uncharacterized protein [Euphorbia lathyris]|uniref:uncharacterized protein n=1 Tax=Euphorbia lathyris TaxID=212925 RepID=UPI003313E0C8
MLVLSMNSKRQRRPNVRLGEIGDVPAAFACGFSQRNQEILGHQTCENHLLNPNDINQGHIYEFALETISPKSSADMLQNRENNNPNSSKSAFEVLNSDDINMAKLKLNFGTITRKCRVMKRRSRNTNVANDVFSHVWSSKISSEDRKDCNLKDFVRFSSDEFNDYVPANGFKDSLDHETSATSKDALRFDAEELTNNEDVCDEGNNMSPVSDNVWDEMNSGGTDVNSVSRWLEEKGFGKYAGMFEMHEVDEEALVLLTLEDLKEIGVFAVGSRRKLYNAIQQLRTSDVCIENTST